MLRVFAAFVAPLALLSILAGCAGAPPQTSTVPEDLRQLQYWQARGRLGISGAGQGGSGSFAWEQQRDRAEVQIRGPIGIGSVRLQMSGPAASPHLRLETADGQVFEANSAWQELESRLGTPIPAQQLRYWMLGVPAPGEHRWLEERTDQTAVLEQDGWRIEYRYTDELSGRLPSRIHAVSGNARVRIVIDRWSLQR
jgi:outer membrane lipoprotein LolB